MIVEIEDKSTGIIRAYGNVMNFWFDTNHFYLKFKEGEDIVLTTIFRRNSRLYRIRDNGYTPQRMIKEIKEDEEWYVILNMNCKYEICRMCPKSGLFKGSYEECEKWIAQRESE